MGHGSLIPALKRALEEGPPLRLALLFGSAARDALRPDSDVDIAILPANPSLSLQDELDLQARLAKAAQREVDLVRLDRASPLLRWRAAKEGVVLLAEPARELVRFRARAGIEHADLEPQMARARELLRRRLAGRASPAVADEADS